METRVAARNVMASIAVAGLVVVGAAVASSGIAAADPAADAAADPGSPDAPPPPGPVVPVIGAPLGPSGLSVLAQSGGDATPGRLGAPDALDLTPGSLVGQYAVPSAPGGAPGATPDLRAFNNAYDLAQNQAPSAPGQGSLVGVAPGDENADISGLDYLARLHELHQNGNFKGLTLAQLAPDQLGQALPGTAPPPGTNLPPGLVPPPPDAPPGG